MSKVSLVKPKPDQFFGHFVKPFHVLSNRVHDRKDVEYVTIYEFLFDRLRAIRQDIIIQRCEEIEAIQILETILRFYILADYK